MGRKRAVWVAFFLVLALSPHMCPAAEGLVINEFLAVNNTTYVDEDSAKSDWIELYNGGTNAADLTDLYLTDDASDLRKWRFPSVQLGVGQYLVVWASDKNRRVPGRPLHTNFKLGNTGEYLAIVDGDGFTVLHAYDPAYPEQLSNVSYGISTNDTREMRYFSTPTPGLRNRGDYLGVVADTKFSVDRGFYSTPFELSITSETPGATIRYTLDCSTPTEVSGTVYSGPITIDKSTVVRALAYKTGYRSTDVDTQSYLFLANALSQPASPAGFPTTWGGGPTSYAMDQSVVGNPQYQMTNALRALPSVSLVTPKPNLFDSSYGIYVNGGGQGVAWERPASVEWFTTNGTALFQSACGVRVQGGAGRGYRKHSFRVFFKSAYGPSKLEAPIFPGPRVTTTFDTFILRAGWNDAFSGGTRLYFLDECTRRSELAMGKPSSHGTFVHLYVDGLYWGLYNAAEKPDQSFGESYYGGSKDSYDVMAIGECIEGSPTPWNDLIGLCQTAPLTDEIYRKMQGLNLDGTPNTAYPNYLDVDNYIDYVMARQWMGDWDWPHNNWHSFRNRDAHQDGGFKFASWDAEGWALGNNKVNPGSMNGGAGVPYYYLCNNAEFRLRVADRVYRHYFNGGALSTNSMVPLFQSLAAIVDPAIMAENARWGWSGYTLAQWRAEKDGMLGGVRTVSATVLQQYKAAGLYPEIDPPSFSRRGGVFTNGFTLSMSSPNAIYFTLDNTDPREFSTGNIAGAPYTQPLALSYSVVVKARARTEGGTWSALNEALFVVPQKAPLLVTEVMYNPRPPVGVETNGGLTADDFEYIELRNATSNRLGLAGMAFTEGIQFQFTRGRVLTLDPGEHVLVVKNRSAFAARYPQHASLRIAGEYGGSLDNGGEPVALQDGLGSEMLAFEYSDGRGWPLAADGAGHALVPVRFTGHDDGMLDYGGNWRAGTYRDGSPGQADPAPPAGVVLNELVAHTDYVNPLRPEYDSNDAIELYNAGTGAVSLAGFYLSDSPGELKKWAIPPATVLAAGAWLGLDEVSGFHSPITAGFGLNKAGDQVYLSYLPGTAADRVVDCVQFKGQENSRSLGRYPDGGPWWYALTPTTNAAAKANAAPVHDVVISEIMYHPQPTPDHPEDNDEDEYIEIRNVGAAAVPFTAEGGAWRLSGGIDYVFPIEFSLPAGGVAVVVSFDPDDAEDATQFMNAYGLSEGEVILVGPFKGKLSNRGDRVALERPQNPDVVGDPLSWVIVDEAIYFDRVPWPGEADGTGQPLQRRSYARSGNDPSNWESGFWSSPGYATPTFRIQQPTYGETLLRGSSIPVVAVFDSRAVSGSVHQVEFRLDGQPLSVDAQPPYGCVLGPLSTERTYTLTATLTDDAGAHPARPVVVGVSTVTNAPASDVGITSARVNGGISLNGSADVRIHWGAADGGTNRAAWANAINLGRQTGGFSALVSGLFANGRYFYRCEASNAYGTLWAPATASFVARPPLVSLSVANSPFFENGGTASVRAHLSRISTTNVTVNLAFSGTATFAADYSVSSTSIVVAAGQTSAAMTLTGVNDPDVEAVESVVVGIGSLRLGTTGTPVTVSASLISDDPRVVNSAASNVTDSAATVGGVLTHGYGSAVTVYWGPVDGGSTKAAWASSTAVGNTAEGAFAATLAGLQANRTYYFRCYALNSGGEDWADSSLSFLTGPPRLYADDTAVAEGNAGTVDAVFTVRLSAKSAIDVSVGYATANATALAGADYLATQGRLLIPAGQASGQVSVPVVGDAEDEWPSERFLVNLSSPTNCTVADGQAAGVIRDDDVAVTLVNWQYRMRVAFPGYRRGETLRDFPALVVLDTNLTNFAYSQFRAAGQTSPWSSLRFANSNVTALLNYEVEQWNTNGRSYVWVQVPELTASNSAIWAYWGNPSALAPPAFSTNGSTWSAGYKGVWHMAAASDRDASPTRRPGIARGSVAQTAGVIGNANDFDADVDYIAVADSEDFTLSGDYTLSAWLNSDNIGNQDEGFLGTYNGNGFMFCLQNDVNNTLRLWASDWRSSDRPIPDGRWMHVAYTRKGTSGRFYINGALVRDRTDALAGGNGGELHIGGAGTSWAENRFDGKLDEVRIAAETRSSNWVWACWFNQASNRAFAASEPVQAADVNSPALFVVYGATNVTDTSAWLTARLTSTGSAATAVWLYWGPEDGGLAPGAWAHTNAFGTATRRPYNYTFQAAGLQPNTTYYYAYRATNSRGTAWAPASFSSAGRPIVANAGATNIGIGSVTLAGRLQNATPAQVRVYWGPADGGASPAAWAASAPAGNVAGRAAFGVTASDLLYGVRYYYRCYATNRYGEDWSDAATAFLSAAPNSSALSVRSGLALWLDAGDLDGDGNTRNNPADGAAVYLWRDRSGLRRDADNLDGNPARLVAAGLNGNPVLSFDGSSYLFTTYDFDALAGYTLFTAARYSGGDSERVIGSRTHNWLFGYWGGGDEKWHADGWIYNGGTANTAWHLHAGTMTAEADPAAAFWKDGLLLTRDNRGSNDSTSKPGRLGLGGGGGAGNEASLCEIAEVLMYDRVLSSNELDAVGSYLAKKYAVATGYSGRIGGMGIGLANAGASNITYHAAELTGTLAASGSVFSVWVHWGNEDGGTARGSWDHSEPIGTFTNVAHADLSFAISGLLPEVRYFYTFSASNAAGDAWASASDVFTTPGDLRQWSMRAPVVFRGYQRGATLTDFPALVTLGTNLPGFAYGQFASASGRDLRFGDPDGRMLDYEVEVWNPGGTSIFWVRVPELEPTGADFIWAYWGNPEAPALPCVTNGAVWTPAARGVWHMQQPATRDATARGHAGTAVGAVASVPGVIAQANEFDPGEYVTVPRSSDFVLNSDYTLSTWLYAHDGNDRGIMGSWHNGFIFAVRGNSLRFHASQNGGGWDSPGGDIALNRWHYATATRAGGAARLYLDGELKLTFTGYPITGCDDDLEFGSGGTDWRGWFDGAVDEARIEAVERPADWVRACFSNQVAGSSFVGWDAATPFHGIANRAVSDVTATSAVFHALLYTGATGYYVNVYWGPTDGATNAAAWAYRHSLGFFANTGSSNLAFRATQGVSDLSPTYYTWMVSNATYAFWARPSAGWDAERVWRGGADRRWGSPANWVGDNAPDAPLESARFDGQAEGQVDLAGHSYTNTALTFAGGDYTLADTNAAPGALRLGALRQIDGANTVAVGMSVTGATEVTGGTLTLARTQSFSAPEFTLNGGTLAVQGPLTYVDGLNESLFQPSPTDHDLSGARYYAVSGRVFAGDKAGTALAMTPTRSTMLYGDASSWNELGGSPGDYFSVYLSGTFFPPATGTYNFHWNQDDRGWLFMDLGNDGVFDSSDAIGTYAWESNGSVSLTAGQGYNFMFLSQEYGGGDNLWFRYTPPGGSEIWVNPSAYPGRWRTIAAGPLSLATIPVRVLADSSLTAQCGTNVAAMGALSVAGGVSLATPQGSPVGFQSTALPAGAATVGFRANIDTYLTRASGLDGSGSAATVVKTGGGSLILSKAGANLGGVIFDVQAGALVGVHSNAFNGAGLQLRGGELKLSSPGGSVAYATSIAVLTNSTISAGKAGGGVAGPLTATLAGPIAFSGSPTLTARATENYTLRLGGPINGSGTLDLRGGSVVIDDPDFNAVTLNGGSLTVYSNLTVNALIQNSGTFAMAGTTKNLTVSGTLTLSGTLNLSGGPTLLLPSATVTLNSGANITYDKTFTAGALTLNNGGTLNLGTNRLSVGTLAWRNGGTLNMTGPIEIGTSASFWPQRTVANRLSGPGDVLLGDPQDNWGYVALTATNTYTGKTQIRLAKLRAADGVGLPAASRLVFRSGGAEWNCVWQTRGTVRRNIGEGPGEISWQEYGGGFASLGGPLTVTLETNAPLTWSSAALGFNNATVLQLGSEDSTNRTELTNPIDLEAGERCLQIGNNPNSRSDFVRLSGPITGDGSFNGSQLRFNNWNGSNFRNALVELTGTNTYSQRTSIQAATLAAVDGVGLPTNSVVHFASPDWMWVESVLLSSGTFRRGIGVEMPGMVSWQWGSGGFAARGGNLTVTFPNVETVPWWDSARGFNGQILQLNSQYASNTVEITNPIDIAGDERYVNVLDNPDTDQDIAVISGAISGSNHGARFTKEGPGTLWLRGANTFQQYLGLDWGAVRIDSLANLSPSTTLTFWNWQRGGDWPKTLEIKGTLAMEVGQWNDAGMVSWQWGDGGFSAYGGPLSVRLAGGATLLWDTWNPGFDGKSLHLGSHTANSVVTMANALDTRGGWRTIRAWGNPWSAGDYAVVTNITSSSGANSGHLSVQGDGTLRIAGAVTQMNYLRVEDNATLLVNGTFAGNNVDSNNGQSGGSYRRTSGGGATPTLGGKGAITAAEVRLRGWSATSYTTLAPGDGVGRLTANLTGSFVLENGNVTYEWELGPGESDTVAVTGSLWMNNGWRLKLKSAGGTPRPTTQYVLFTYSGTCTYAAPALDLSGLPADWVTGGAQVVHDTANKRIYLTGIYSTLAIANDPPADLTSTSATLRGFVSAQADPLHVSVYWSTNNGGTSAAAWLAQGHKAEKGSCTNAIGQGVSHAVSGLATNQLWYYTFRATNAAGTLDLWAAPVIAFRTLGPPVVTNAGASVILVGKATLNGGFVGHNRGAVTLCWGTRDGGATSPANWQNRLDLGPQSGASFSATVTGLLYPLRYYYRCFAENPYGQSWSAAATFTATGKPAAAPVLTGLVAWYDAGTGVTNDGSGVLTWRDRSGAGHHGTRSAGNPTFAAGQINGRPTVQFRGNDDRLDVAGTLFTKEQYVVVRSPRTTWSEHGAFLGRRTGRESNYLTQSGNTGFHSNQYPLEVRRNGVTVTPSETCLAPITDWMLLKIVVNNNNATAAQYWIGRGDYSGVECDIAEILGYSATLSTADEARVGGYLAAKYGLTTPYPTVPAVTVTNLQATRVGLGSGTLNARINCTGAVYNAWAFWGPGNGGTNRSAWAHRAFAGTVTDGVATVSHAVAPGTGTWWYTFLASNALDQIWASPSTNFTTVRAPAVNNSTGAVAAVGQATLRGALTAGVQADVYFYWGRGDGGTTPGAWEHVAKRADQPQGGVQAAVTAGYGFSYFYRCFASNEAGTAWAPESRPFTLPVPVAYVNGIEEVIFDQTIGDALGNIEAFRTAARTLAASDAKGILAGRLHYPDDASVSARAAALGAVGFNSEAFAMLWVTDFCPTQSGAWGFRTTGSIDDNTSWWIDTDGNGTFEVANRWYYRSCCGASGDTATPALTAGRTYKLGIVLNDTGGNGFIQDFEFRPPGGSWTDLNPSEPAQNGLWRIPAPPQVSLANTAASDVWANSATLGAALLGNGWSFDLYCHWGPTNGAWTSHAFVGTFSHLAALTPVTWTVTDLAPVRDYYYTFQASNAVTNVWASPGLHFVTAANDADGDGLPDAWERAHFGGTNVTSGLSGQDFDGDGASDRDEFVSGTESADADSRFTLEMTLSNGQVVVRFRGLEADGTGYEGLERRYDVEESTNGVSGPWGPVPGRTNLLGGGGFISHTNHPGPRAYFRGKVRLQ